MSRKRKAEHQLTKDNYKLDNKPSGPVGYGFEKAADDVLKKRKRLKVKRKIGTADEQLPEEAVPLPMDTTVTLNDEDFEFDFKQNETTSMWVLPEKEGEEEQKKSSDSLIIPPPPAQDARKVKKLEEENDDLMERIRDLEKQLRENNTDLTETPKPKEEEEKKKEEEPKENLIGDIFDFGGDSSKSNNDDIPFDFLPNKEKIQQQKQEKEEEKEVEEEKKKTEGGSGGGGEGVFDGNFNIPSAFGQDQNFVFSFGDTAGSFDDTPSKLHVSLTSPFGKGGKAEGGSGTDLWAPKEGDDLGGSDLNVGSPLPPPKYDLKEVNYEHKSGEEGEENRFKCPAKLYILSKKPDGSQYWRERGIGEVKVNVKKTDEGVKVGNGRLLMHRGESLILLLNCPLFENFVISKLSQKKITFTCVDFGDDDEEEARDNEKEKDNQTKKSREGNSFLMTFRAVKDCEEFLKAVKSLTENEKKVRKEK